MSELGSGASSSRPDDVRLTGRSIVAFSSNDWSDIPSSSSQLMTYLGQRNRILYIDTVGIRNPRLSLSDGVRAWGKLQRSLRPPTRPADGVFVWSPVAIPFHGSRLARRVNALLLSGATKRRLRRLGMSNPIIYVALPGAAPVVERFPSSKVLYHCVDDYREFTFAPGAAYAGLEEQLLRRANLTVVTSQRLYELRSVGARRIAYIPHGVDVAAFRQALDHERHVPELDMLAAPIAGFVGRIGDWIDLDLLVRCARELPEWHIVVVGPSNVPLERYRGLPNLHFLGRRDHAEVPHLIRRFTVCLLPFVDNRVTVSVNPLKVYEYLALGRPVVAVPMPELDQFGNLVSVVDTSQFPRAIVEAARRDTPELRAARLEAISRRSWADVAEAMFRLLDDEGGALPTPANPLLGLSSR